MTTVFLTEKKCFVCGRKNRYPQVGTSMTIIGTKDLDGRPAQMQRSSIYMLIQRCIFCGYCTMDISDGLPEDKQVVESKEYAAQLTNQGYPETANAYLCRSLICEKSGRLSDAGWAAVYAAWICDDNQFTDAADLCRGRALILFSKAREHHQQYCESSQEEALLIVDLMRRRGEFDAALALCEQEMDKTHSEEFLDLINLEQHLIKAKDRSCHGVTEAEEFDD